jgi:hypothetical protein
VLLGAAPLIGDEAKCEPGGYGVYICSDAWGDGAAADPSAIGLNKLFDDPNFEDLEPVAVCRRKFTPWTRVTDPALPQHQADLKLASGKPYSGPTATLFASSLYANQHEELPGQKTNTGAGPIFAAPPEGLIDHIRIYASYRDRFDDPQRPRVPGTWEHLVTIPTTPAGAGGLVPADVPTVLAGFTKEGTVARWTTAAADAQGTRATFYAYAGDHYSVLRQGTRNFCVGCHPGHSGLGPTDHQHHEKAP